MTMGEARGKIIAESINPNEPLSASVRPFIFSPVRKLLRTVFFFDILYII